MSGAEGRNGWRAGWAALAPSLGLGLSLGLSLGLGLGLVPLAPARAAPWVQPEGEGIVILQTTPYTASTRGFDTNGRPNGQGRFGRLELAAPYWEHGVTSNWTVGLQPRLQAAWLNEPGNRNRNIGLADASAFARYQLYKGRLDVLSVQALVATPGLDAAGTTPRIGEPNMAAEIRGLYGIGSALPWGMTGFASAEVAFRGRIGNAADEIRIDIGFGLRPTRQWLLMLQSFSNLGLRNNSNGGADYSVSKLQATVAYEFDREWAVALGYMRDVAGRRVPLGQGAVMALWYRY